MTDYKFTKKNITKTLDNYNNIFSLIEQRDIEKWCSLKKMPETYNLASMLFYSALQKNNKIKFAPLVYASDVLKTLDSYLHYFSELKTDESFKKKIKNLNGFTFFDTLSELSIAKYMSSKGYNIIFEEKFFVDKKEKDVDIKATSNDNTKVLFIDVYTPNNIADIDGFFNLDEYVSEIGIKVRNKAIKKFSNAESKIHNKRFLAINTYLSEMYNVSSLLQNKDDIFKEVEKRYPLELDGLIIFYDNFVSIDSIKINFNNFKLWITFANNR